MVYHFVVFMFTSHLKYSAGLPGSHTSEHFHTTVAISILSNLLSLLLFIELAYVPDKDVSFSFLQELTITFCVFLCLHVCFYRSDGLIWESSPEIT